MHFQSDVLVWSTCQQKQTFLTKKIWTERSKTSVLESVFDAESGEKNFKAIIFFLKTVSSKSQQKTRFSGILGFLRYFEVFGRKISFYLNKNYIFGFSASNCIGLHKKIRRKNFAEVLHCANLTSILRVWEWV